DGLATNKTGVWKFKAFSSWGLEDIRATAANDMFVMDNMTMIAHYNGSTWRTYTEANPSGVIYRSSFVTKRCIAMVGLNARNRKCVITIGRR
ncbi:MAG: hypothetical protein ACM3Q4_16520, partial [Acidobacteriota bacterium]